MPTYDYRCKECGHELAEFQSISAEPLTACPNCGRAALRRLIGAGAGIIFKGSGFLRDRLQALPFVGLEERDEDRVQEEQRRIVVVFVQVGHLLQVRLKANAKAQRPVKSPRVPGRTVPPDCPAQERTTEAPRHRVMS